MLRIQVFHACRKGFSFRFFLIRAEKWSYKMATVKDFLLFKRQQERKTSRPQDPVHPHHNTLQLLHNVINNAQKMKVGGKKENISRERVEPR